MADNLVLPSAPASKLFVQTNSGQLIELQVAYATDGNSNLVPLANSTLQAIANEYLRIIAEIPFTPPDGADAIVASYPDELTDIFQYKQGGVSGTVLMTVTVTYTSYCRDKISSVVKT